MVAVRREPAERVIEVLSSGRKAADRTNFRRLRAPTSWASRSLLLKPRVSLAKNARFTLGCTRVARVAGLAFLCLRGNDLLHTKPEKYSLLVEPGVIRATDARQKAKFQSQRSWRHIVAHSVISG
jgi:hypothetical protein